MKDLSLVIVQGHGPALLGRDWLGHIKLDWPVIVYYTVDKLKVEETLQENQEVFRDELGTTMTPAVSLTIKDQSQLKFVHARLVPFAIKEAGRLIGWKILVCLRKWNSVDGRHQLCQSPRQKGHSGYVETTRPL